MSLLMSLLFQTYSRALFVTFIRGPSSSHFASWYTSFFLNWLLPSLKHSSLSHTSTAYHFSASLIIMKASSRTKGKKFSSRMSGFNKIFFHLRIKFLLPSGLRVELGLRFKWVIIKLSLIFPKISHWPKLPTLHFNFLFYRTNLSLFERRKTSSLERWRQDKLRTSALKSFPLYVWFRMIALLNSTSFSKKMLIRTLFNFDRLGLSLL